MKNQFIQVIVSCESEEQANMMADVLLNDAVIACAQIMPKIESFYRWQGQIAHSSECLLVLKSHHKHFTAIEACIKKLHTYEIPEIIAVPIVDGSREYLKWINEEIK